MYISAAFWEYNYTTRDRLLWKNNHETVSAAKAGTVTEVTKVDGSVILAEKAVDAMNTALQNAGSKVALQNLTEHCLP